MLSIKASSEGEALHTNSIGKPNKMFACFVIVFLAMALLFDCFHVHNSLVAPVPYSKKHLTSNKQQMLQHNQEILIMFCLQHNPKIAQKYFMNTSGENIFSMHSYLFVLHYFIQTCDNIHSWISLSGDLAFSHQDGIYGFKFPKRFLEISSRDLTSSFLFCQS
jgi:hypothetical protein